MRKTVIVSLVVLMLLGIGIVFAAPDEKGNGLPKGKCYNLNIIGVPNPKQVDFDGGNGARIFVKREGSTLFYVHGGDHYEVYDRNGTDGKVGWGIGDPGIEFPYEGVAPTGEWKVQIYVRLLGPKDSSVNWETWVPSFLAGPSFTDEYGQTWYLYGSFSLNKADTKFSLRTSELLPDAYQDVLWILDPVHGFRLIQMRIFVEE